MQNIDFKELLGKHISTVEKVISNDFENKLFGKEFYYIKDENITKNLYGISFNSLTILTDENEIIESITIHLPKVIDKEFYNQFIKIYGYPNEIKVIQRREEISNDFIEDEIFSQEVKKSNIELRDGSFEDNPLFIIWEKEKFVIKVLSRHEQGVSEITFENKKPFNKTK